MNKLFSHILVGGVSALAGAVAGYFFCKKQTKNLVDEEISRRVNEELERIRESRKKTDENNEPIKTECINSPTITAKVSYDDIVELIAREFPDDTVNPYRVNLVASCLLECQEEGLDEDQTDDRLRALFASFESPSEDESDEEDTEEEEEIDSDYEQPQLVMEDYQGQPPKVIPLEEYRNLPPYFEFLTYHYFEEDDVLIDDQEMIVPDVEEVIGDALMHFDEEPDDGDCVYVVNGNYGNAIEVVRMHCTYTGWSGWGD